MLSQSKQNKKGVTCEDLLTALHFLKTYSTEDHLSNLFGNTSKIFREKYEEALFILTDLDIICFENRKVKENLHHKAKISIDGTDSPIQEQ